MKETDALWIYLDLRKFEAKGYLSYRDIVLELEKSLQGLPKKIKKMLVPLKGVNLAGLELKLSWGNEKVELSDILERLSDISEKENRAVIIVIDESQELRKLKGYNLLSPIAYAYDNLSTKFILTGSEIGMVHKFLKLNDPKSPLFGRAMSDVVVKPFPKEVALEFMRRGFDQFSVKVEDKLLEEVYEEVGGIPGWLTYYGFQYIQERDHKKALAKTIHSGVSLIRREFNNFLIRREVDKRRYYTIMKTYKKGGRWNDIRRALEAQEGLKVDDKKVTELIQNLVDASFLVKDGEEYRPADVLIGQAF